MTYKGYTGEAALDTDSGVYYGTVDGINDVVTFQGGTPQEAAAAFRNSINVYLALCARRGEAPDEPPTEVLKLRLQPTLLSRANAAAAKSGRSLNALITGLLRAEVAGGQATEGLKKAKPGKVVPASGAAVKSRRRAAGSAAAKASE